MTNCPCEFPLDIIDKRAGKEIEYLAMPFDLIKSGIKPPEDIDVVEEEIEGKKSKFVAVIWKKPSEKDDVKKYLVRGHIVIAGCEPSLKEGKLQCDEKDLYMVLHPAEEWLDYHIVELTKKKKE